jgi:hypothetical protein
MDAGIVDAVVGILERFEVVDGLLCLEYENVLHGGRGAGQHDEVARVHTQILGADLSDDAGALVKEFDRVANVPADPHDRLARTDAVGPDPAGDEELMWCWRLLQDDAVERGWGHAFDSYFAGRERGFWHFSANPVLLKNGYFWAEETEIGECGERVFRPLFCHGWLGPCITSGFGRFLAENG